MERHVPLTTSGHHPPRHRQERPLGYASHKCVRVGLRFMAYIGEQVKNIHVWVEVLYRSRKFLLSAKMLRVGRRDCAPGPQWPSPRQCSSAADSIIVMRLACSTLTYEAAVETVMTADWPAEARRLIAPRPRRPDQREDTP